MQCIEDLLENDLILNLKYLYNKDDDTQTMLIFFIRCFIYFDSIDLSDEQYIEFLLKELNLPKKLIYKNEEISLGRYGTNSLQNIMDNFIYRYLETLHNDTIRGQILGKELLLYYLNNYREKALRTFKYKKKKDIKEYKNVFKYVLLENVYNDFSINIQPIKYFDNFNYFNLKLESTFDEVCKKAYNNYIEHEEKLIEKELENYICKNQIDDIRIINRQMKIQSGIIDLLGIDENNKKVLIELKVTSRPVGLLWQLNAYTQDLINYYKEDIRTVVVAPKLDDNILKQIPEKYEIYEFVKRKDKYNFKKIR
jgi:hypothetical protein